MKRKRISRERRLIINCAKKEATEEAVKIVAEAIVAIRKTAKTMLADGLEPQLVARYTKLPIKQIKAIRVRSA